MKNVKKRVLFLCTHNSARSQMAAAFLKQAACDRFDVESAGLEPGKLNPLVVTAMKQIGIDISRNETQSVFDLFKRGQRFQYVISVCDEASAERCPIFPGGHDPLELELRRSLDIHGQRRRPPEAGRRHPRRNPGQSRGLPSHRLYKTR